MTVSSRQSEIEAAVRKQLPELFETIADQHALRVAIRLSIEFSELVEQVLSADDAGSGSEFHTIRDGRTWFKSASKLTCTDHDIDEAIRIDRVAYVNESTVACAEFLWNASRLVKPIAGFPANVVTWVAYLEMGDLCRDYRRAFNDLIDPKADRRSLAAALMTANMLRVAFLAATF